MIRAGLAKKINILSLLIAIAAVVVLPLKKEIWYDESISVLCSKGITYDTHNLFAGSTTITGAAIEQLNTPQNVFNATVADNGNSFLFNICLHWLAPLAGNTIPAYMLLSKLCGIATLLAFFVLCNLFLKDSIFTALAILLLAADINFMGMSHEIRAYAMGTLFTTLAGICYYKFSCEREKPIYIFFLALFCVAAVLSHYLSLYVILVFLVCLVLAKKAGLFSLKNIAALIIPLAIIAIYFYFSYIGLKYMSAQNAAITHRAAAKGFSFFHVLLRSMALGSTDFNVVFSAFGEKKPLIIFSFLLVIALYITAVKNVADKADKKNLHILFILGASGSIFLALLCIKSHHYTALYNRYHSFCIPYACLFTAYMMSVLYNSSRINKLVKGAAIAIIVLPCVLLSFLFFRKSNPDINYNHIAIAKEIQAEKVSKIEVPSWDDAFLVQSFLPTGYKIDYVLNPVSSCFTIYKTNAQEKVPVVKHDS